MKLERVILFTVLVAVVFIATIVLFVFKTFTPTPDQQINQPQVVRPTSTPSSSTQPTTTTVLPASDTHNALDDCIELKANDAQGREYARGSLLVTFPVAVTFSSAVDIVQSVGVNADTSSDAEETFESQHWLTVSVPRGEEFKWQCLLENADGVRRANLNFIFNLRQ